MRKTIIVIITSILLVACKSGGQDTIVYPTKDVVQKEVQQVSTGLKTQSISSNSVNGFYRGAPLDLDKSTQGKTLTKVDMRSDDQSAYEYYYILGKEKGLRVFPAKDPRTNTYANIVGEVSILSSAYTDSKGIQVGSSVLEFQKKYPEAYAYYDLKTKSIRLSDQGKGLQYIVSADDLQYDTQIQIGRIKFDQISPNAKINEIRIMRSKQENDDAAANPGMEEVVIIESYLESVLGNYYLNEQSEKYIKIHKLQGDYFISDCFEGDCDQIGQILSCIKNKNGFVGLQLKGITGEMVPTWTLNTTTNKTELHVHDYNVDTDSWEDLVYTK